MRKTLIIILLALCLSATFTVAVNAAPDPMAAMFQDQLILLDMYYDFDYEYMIRIATDEFISWDDYDWEDISVSAEEFDAALHKYFDIDEQTIEEIREFGNRNYNGPSRFFDEETQTYTFMFLGGFGGNLPPREYLGYVQNDDTYDIYYRNLTYEFLDDLLDDEAFNALLGEEWPDTVEYNGNIYEPGPEGYYRILSHDNFGRKYTVEVNGDIVRVLSCVNYTEEHLPDTFDDKTVEEEVTYDIPENGNIAIPENDCFDGNTIVKVEEIQNEADIQTVNMAMETVAQKFIAYDFTATKNNTAVQPNGKLTVVFTIPDGYSNNVTVFYMDKDGMLSKLNTTVDAAARTATAELEHFSTYILADEDSKPESTEPETTVPETTAPETTVPETTVPETTVAETTVPETTVPETTVPETTVPETTAPETTVAETTVPETTVPETTVPETTVPETTVPETTVPETTVPETTVPETTVPETTVPETTVPETTVPETTVPETTVPETTAPETTAPETTVPETTVPETTVPETTVPETTVAETTVAETTVPETTVAETTVPKTTVPETNKPAITEPESSDPVQSDSNTTPVESSEEEAQTNIMPNETVPTDSDNDGASSPRLGIIIAVIVVSVLAVGAIVLIKIKKKKTTSN